VQDERKPLILKSPKADIKIHSDYLEITLDGLHYVVGYSHISEIYLNKNIAITLSDLLKIALKKPISLINHYGYVVAEIRIPHARRS